jgi:RNA polymerase sigma-70 factor (ECF subfamily)
MERTPELTADASPPGDELDVVFRAHSGYVAQVALRVLGRPDDVDDVVQEVFLVAMGGLHKLRDADAIRGWLATVAVRRARRRLRRRRVWTFFGFDEGSDYSRLAVDATQEEAALVARIYRILDGLPIEQRIAWTLRNVEGEKLEAVAALCECSLATVKRRIGAAQETIEKAVLHG